MRCQTPPRDCSQSRLTDPLLPGAPTQNPQIAGKRFVFAGRFIPVPRAELVRRIKAAGGLVRVTLSPITDYIVIGSNAGWKGFGDGVHDAERIDAAELLRMLGAPQRKAESHIFPLGREDGDEHALDLRTGRLLSRLNRASAEGAVLEPDDVTPSLLEQAYLAAGLDTAWDEDGDLLVRIFGDFANVVVMPERKQIRFIKLFEISEFAPDELKFAMANRLNVEWDVVRFHVPVSTRLVADYTLPYDQGVSPLQLVMVLQGFVATVIEALGSCPDAGLIA